MYIYMYANIFQRFWNQCTLLAWMYLPGSCCWGWFALHQKHDDEVQMAASQQMT